MPEDVMASRYLCSTCGLNHPARQACPQHTDLTENQKLIDAAEAADIQRFNNGLILWKVTEEAYRRALAMEKLEQALRMGHGW